MTEQTQAKPLAAAPPAPIIPKPATTVRLVGHVIAANGIEVDVELDNVVFDSPEGAAKRAAAFAVALAANGLKPRENTPTPIEVKVDTPAGAPAGPGRGRGKGRPAGGARGSKYTGEIYEICPWCEGDMYDNRQKKANDPSWRGPWFKCKDDDCGFVVFKNDGTPNE